MRAYRQFIVNRLEPKPDGKINKIPLCPLTLTNANAHDPKNWLSFDEAATTASLAGPNYTVAFVLTSNDPFYCVDIDDCREGDNWSQVALNVMSMLPGAAVEVSTSHKGLHIFGMYQGDEPDHGCKNTALKLEMYTSGRFITLTGINAVGNCNTVHDLSEVVRVYFPPTVQGEAAEWTDGPVPEWNGIADDAELFEKLCGIQSASSVFGEKATFKQLWHGDISGCNNDASSADASMATTLAWATGKDCERIERMMRLSGLVRDKWDRKDGTYGTYLKRTIIKACSLCQEVYGEQQTVEPTPIDISTTQIEESFQFLGPTQQIDHFEGCYYVQDCHRVFIPTGELLKPEQFNAVYGGYQFQLDTNGKTTKKAWEAFTESQVVRYPKPVTTCFKPTKEPGSLVIDNGRLMVNVYTPVKTECKKGDPTPFLKHLSLLIPDERDRRILLSWMAAIAQHKGKKFQWAILIQGVEGNGKTLLSRILSFIVGAKYTHYPSSHDIANPFNSWLAFKLLICIEDIYTPGHRSETEEVLKPLITNQMIEVQFKGRDQVMMDNNANFIINTNHKDGLRKHEGDRRYAIFYTQQQVVADLKRDGMDGDYFPDLYNWFDNEDGYAIVHDFLMEYKIDEEFNPASACQRAPKTSSTDEAVSYSTGGLEQVVQEAIEEGKQGFTGGWVSSTALNNLIDNLPVRLRVALNKRRELMQKLGYDWHPALRDGRASRFLMVDQGKPRLYIKNDHPHRGITDAEVVLKTYESSQTGNSMLTAPSIQSNIGSEVKK